MNQNQTKVQNKIADFVPGPVPGETARFFGLIATTQPFLHKPIAVRATCRVNQHQSITHPVNRPKDNVRKSKVNTRRRRQ